MIEYNKYSRENLQTLLGILDPMPQIQVKHLCYACEIACGARIDEVPEVFFGTVLHSHATTRDQLWMLYHEPIEAVLLYINDKDPVIIAIAKWRLTIAK